MLLPPPLWALLDELLGFELRAVPELSPARRQAARQLLARELASRALPERGFSLSCGDLDEALARAVEVARGPRASALGSTLDDKYELVELLAVGGFGEVYRARDRDLDCEVAVKLLRPALGSTPESVEAFKQEARRLTRLKHPNIVEWKTLNQSPDGRLYLVMELLEGELLESVLVREGRLAPARATRILLEVLDALGHAHELADGTSLLHLDLKPGNVFLVRGHDGRERAKVLDFGISRFVGERAATTAGLAAADALGATTCVPVAGAGDAQGGLACTPLYCPPELAWRALGDPRFPLDGRADLYSLGVMAYRMLVGRTPFESAGGLFEVLRHHREVPAPSLGTSGARVRPALARFVARCLEKDPERRHASAREAHAALARATAPARPFVWTASVAAMLALAVLLWRLPATRPDPVPLALVDPTAPGAPAELLFFGAQRTARTIELLEPAESADSAGGARFALLGEPVPGGREVEGWSVHALSGHEVEITAEARTPGRTRVFLARTIGARTRVSAPLTLAFAGPEDWRVETFDVPGRAGRRLAPGGQVLELEVRGPRDLLPAGASVLVGGEAVTARRDEARSDPGRSLYPLDLGLLSWSQGPVEVRARIEDRAGNVLEHVLALDVVETPLRIERCELSGGSPVGGRWHLLAGEPPELRVTCNRPCALAWSLHDAAGRTLHEGRSAQGAAAHALRLDGTRWSTELFGTLRVRAEESAWVAHATGAPGATATAELALEVRGSGAVFGLELPGARAGDAAARTSPTRRVEVGVLRDHDVPMRVDLRLEPEDGSNGSAPAVAALSFEAPQERHRTAELEASGDGRFRLVAEGHRLDAGGVPIAEVDLRQELAVVIDTEPPELGELEVPETIRTRAALEALVLPLRVHDARAWDAGVPLVVAWNLELQRASGPSSTFVGERTLTQDEPALLRLPLAEELARAGAQDADLEGTYRLRLELRDHAGHRAPPRSAAWQVSLRGPSARVLSPPEGTPWTGVEEGLAAGFELEVRAEDPNGVAEVRCELRDASGELPGIATELRPVELGVGVVWRGRFVLDHRWSGREVRLALRARDGAGTWSDGPVEVARVVGSITSRVPEHVVVRFRGRGETSMRRVRGNAEASYVFGGRGDSFENAAFRASGLGSFSNRAVASSLRIEIPRGAIDDYYLDEHEVSVAQVLEFLRAPEAAASEPWASQAAGQERRRVLEAALSGQDGDLPATGLTFREAAAYARWVGKRLPTYLHWEYAVRGADARPYSFFGTVALERSAGSVNVASGAPWPVERGEDRTPDTGILDLCSNVAEWTVTPAREPLSQRLPAELLAFDAAAPGERLCVVGGSYARSSFHFGVLDRVAPEDGSESIGFRCLLPAHVADPAFLDGSPDYDIEGVP